MKFSKTLLSTLLVTTIFGSAKCGVTDERSQVGRYVAVVLQYGARATERELLGAKPEVLIIDTKEAPMWLWYEGDLAQPGGGYKIETFIRYQGKLQPGAKEGETHKIPTVSEE
jgi:hypothetical protein